MKTKFLLIALFPTLLIGCKYQSNPTKVEYDSYVVDFSSFDLAGKTLLQSSDGTFKEKVQSYISSKCENCVQDIEYSDGNKIKIAKDTFPAKLGETQALVLASQNYDGFLSVTFTKKLASVKVQAQQYYNIAAGYSGDPHNYPYYDCQIYDEESSSYVADKNAALNVNDKKMHIDCVTYEYNSYGYPEIVIPPVCEETIKINSTTLKLEALASYRMRVFELTLYFAR